MYYKRDVIINYIKYKHLDTQTEQSKKSEQENIRVSKIHSWCEETDSNGIKVFVKGGERWEQQTDDQQKTYHVNKTTGEISLKFPEPLSDATESPSQPSVSVCYCFESIA